MNIKALVFDFDGLILDTEVPSLRSWQEIFEEHGVALSLELWGQHIGTAGGTFDACGHLESLLGRAVPRQELVARRRARSLELVELERPREGVERWLLEAERLGLRLGVASSSQRAWLEEHLGRHGLLERFICLRGRDDVDGRAKPAPDVYLSALKALGVAPAEAIAIEDSPHGLAAAKAAGMSCVVVPNDVTRPLRFDQADLVLESMAHLTLTEVLSRLTAR